MKFKSLLALGCFLCLAGRGEDIVDLSPLEYSLSVEPLVSYNPDDLAREEKLGLAGARLDFQFDNGIRAGLGAYVSVAGPRGGLILVGAQVGYRITLLPHLYVQPELFVGGGGGSRVPVGGGLMLRPAVSLHYDFGPLIVGAGYSWVRFPDSKIDSHEPFVNVAIPSDLAFVGSDNAAPSDHRVGIDHWRVMAIGEGLIVRGKSDQLGKPLGDFAALAGIALDHSLGRALFTTFRIEGAMSGDIAGFLRASLGVGYELALGGAASISPILHAGVAGGAGTPTGGGVIAQPELVLAFPIFDPLSLRLGAGYFCALDGDFRVPSGSLALAAKFDGLSGVPTARRGVTARGPRHTRSDWRVSLSSERYFLKGKATSRSGRPLDDIDLIGIGFDYRFSRMFFVDFTSYWPYAGNAGGYAVGLLGVGFVPISLDRLSLELRLKAGAAGGGGIPAGGGLVGQGSAGLDVAVGDGLSLFAEGGRLVFAHGLSAFFAETGLRYAFGWPVTSPGSAP